MIRRALATAVTAALLATPTPAQAEQHTGSAVWTFTYTHVVGNWWRTVTTFWYYGANGELATHPPRVGIWRPCRRTKFLPRAKNAPKVTMWTCNDKVVRFEGRRQTWRGAAPSRFPSPVRRYAAAPAGVPTSAATPRPAT